MLCVWRFQLRFLYFHFEDEYMQQFWNPSILWCSCGHTMCTSSPPCANSFSCVAYWFHMCCSPVLNGSFLAGKVDDEVGVDVGVFPFKGELPLDRSTSIFSSGRGLFVASRIGCSVLQLQPSSLWLPQLLLLLRLSLLAIPPLFEALGFWVAV